MSHSYSPVLHSHRWMKTNRTFQKSLWNPLAQAVSLSRERTRPPFYLKRRGFREGEQKWRARRLCGGSVEAGALFKQRKVQYRGQEVLRCLAPLSAKAMVLSAAFVASGHLLGAEL